jgi:hypothetical protein
VVEEAIGFGCGGYVELLQRRGGWLDQVKIRLTQPSYRAGTGAVLGKNEDVV